MFCFFILQNEFYALLCSRLSDMQQNKFHGLHDTSNLMIASIIFLLHFQVDLEHNQYRSFQGFTCLMQISTRTEDFIVDTLKLRIYIGLYLQEPFKDPTKRKVFKNYKIMPLCTRISGFHSFLVKQVMHGADRDIMWLQRDFHIYVCNLFDTGQVCVNQGQ